MVNDVKFILKEPNSDKESLIYSILYINGSRLKISTGLKIHPNKWNLKSQKVKSSSPKALLINQRLLNISHDIEEAYLHYINNNKSPTPNLIRKYLHQKELEKKATPSPSKSLMDYFSDFIELKKSELAPSTIKTYVTCLNHLRIFASKHRIALTFDSIDSDFQRAFLNYLWKSAKLNNNSTGKVIKNLKVFLRWATKKGYNTKKDFLEFKVLNEESDQIALTMVELNSIKDLNLSDSPHLSNARDLFLIQCYTGLRYSDIAKLKPSNINHKYLLIHTVKTKDILKIPITPPLKELIDKFLNRDIRIISSQKLNDYIKEVATKAEINEKILTVTYRGNKRIEQEHPKHDLITSHTGRRTFITLSLENGMRPEVLQKVTGHTTMKHLQKYIKITDTVAENELMNAWNY